MAIMAAGTGVATASEIEVVEVAETVDLPVFYVATAAVPGGSVEETWVKIDIVISSSTVSSCMLEI